VPIADKLVWRDWKRSPLAPSDRLPATGLRRPASTDRPRLSGRHRSPIAPAPSNHLSLAVNESVHIACHFFIYRSYKHTHTHTLRSPHSFISSYLLSLFLFFLSIFFFFFWYHPIKQMLWTGHWSSIGARFSNEKIVIGQILEGDILPMACHFLRFRWLLLFVLFGFVFLFLSVFRNNNQQTEGTTWRWLRDKLVLRWKCDRDATAAIR